VNRDDQRLREGLDAVARRWSSHHTCGVVGARVRFGPAAGRATRRREPNARRLSRRSVRASLSTRGGRERWRWTRCGTTWRRALGGCCCGGRAGPRGLSAGATSRRFPGAPRHERRHDAVGRVIQRSPTRSDRPSEGGWIRARTSRHSGNGRLGAESIAAQRGRHRGSAGRGRTHADLPEASASGILPGGGGNPASATRGRTWARGGSDLQRGNHLSGRRAAEWELVEEARSDPHESSTRRAADAHGRSRRSRRTLWR